MYCSLHIDVVNTLARAPINCACACTRRTTDSDIGPQVLITLSPSPVKWAASRSGFVSIGRSYASLRAPRVGLRSLANESSTSLTRDHIKAMGLLHTQLNDALRHHVYTATAELLSSYSEEQIGISCMIGRRPCVSTRCVSSPDSPVSCLLSMRVLHLSTLVIFAIGTNSIPKPVSSSKPCRLPKRLFALEEHIVSPSLEAEVIAGGVVQRNPPGTLDKLKDVGAGRIAAMNAGHLSMQVLAHESASGLEDPKGCRAANDAVRSAVVSRPTRFAGFAVLPMSLPEEAAAELNRSVTTLGFKGAMVRNRLKDGTYYDAARFNPVFAMAQKLNVPLYLHPATPTADIASKLFAGNYPVAVAGKLGVTS